MFGVTAFKDAVNEKMDSGSGLSQAEFSQLQTQYAELNGLAKYAVSSWMSLEYPALDGALRGAGFPAYEAAGGRVER